MRVLHVYSGNLYGGVEALLATIARHRALCADLEPQFALCFEGRLSQTLDSMSVLVHRLGAVRVSRPWRVWQARRQLASLLRRERFDAVITHSCWPHAVFAPIVREAGTKLVFWAHDRLEGKHWLERWARTTPPDLAIANSRFTARALPELFPGVRCEVIYCPVAPPETLDRVSTREGVRRALDTAPGRVVIIQVSRMEPWKGHALLFKALGRLANHPGWECWIVGGAQRAKEKEYLNRLRDQTTALSIAPRVRFLGERTDARQLMAAADIYCQPNLGPEPFGISFIEALYAGVPVVTTRLGAAREIIETDTGVLVTPGHDHDLADALRHLIDNPSARQAFSARGPSRARELCDPAGRLATLRDCLARLNARRVAG